MALSETTVFPVIHKTIFSGLRAFPGEGFSSLFINRKFKNTPDSVKQLVLNDYLMLIQYIVKEHSILRYI